MFIPNGRLSAVERDGEKIQIQTEFALHPHPRVTTSVVYGGRVIHKEERAWEADTETPEGQQQLEAFLQRQHYAVHGRVERHRLELAARLPQAARSDVAMPSAAGPGRHPAGRTPGVLRLFIVGRSGDLLAADDSGVPGPRSAALFSAAAEFIEFWETSESERFSHMLTRNRESDYLLVRHFGKYWGAELAPGADPDATLRLFVAALEQ